MAPRARIRAYKCPARSIRSDDTRSPLVCHSAQRRGDPALAFSDAATTVGHRRLLATVTSKDGGRPMDNPSLGERRAREEPYRAAFERFLGIRLAALEEDQLAAAAEQDTAIREELEVVEGRRLYRQRCDERIRRRLGVLRLGGHHRLRLVVGRRGPRRRGDGRRRSRRVAGRVSRSRSPGSRSQPDLEDGAGRASSILAGVRHGDRAVAS